MTAHELIATIARMTPPSGDAEDNAATLSRIIAEAQTFAKSLAAAPGEYGELVAGARKFVEDRYGGAAWLSIVTKLIDAIATLSAKLAAAEAQRDVDRVNMEAFAKRADDLRAKLAAAEARADELERERDQWRERAVDRDDECERRARKQWDAEAREAKLREALTLYACNCSSPCWYPEGSASCGMTAHKALGTALASSAQGGEDE